MYSPSYTGAVIDKNSEDISTMFKQETSLLSKAPSADVFLDAVTEFVDRNNTQAYTASSEWKLTTGSVIE